MKLTPTLLVGFMALALWDCQTPDPPLRIIPTDPLLAPQASLVSIQPTSATTAQLVVKVLGQLGGWQLTGRSTGGQTIAIVKTGEGGVGPFSLVRHAVSGLVENQSYDFQLRFRFANLDSVTALRQYIHRPDMANWTELVHAPLDGGEYFAYPVSLDRAQQGGAVAFVRYGGPEKVQSLTYERSANSWFQRTANSSSTRRSTVQYVLLLQGTEPYFYSGLGYKVDELANEKFFYFRDIYNSQLGFLYPEYQGDNGEVAFFNTTEEAYFITQNASSAMRSVGLFLKQTVRASLPEPPGLLATFVINGIGYVVNQRIGQPIRLWAYDPKADTWQRRADFPGAVRSRGAAFSVAGKGYFGLGVDSEQRGLRDIWQYDPALDRWQYVTDYPGQGNRYLAVLSAPQRAYVGWGYESQLTSTGAVRQVPCTDWWEFKP